MSDARCSPHGWTLDTLERHLTVRVDALEKSFKTISDEREDRNKERFTAMKTAVDAALASSDRAVTKAEIATEKRFEGVNEFRSALSDQSSNLLPRIEYSVQYQGLIDRLSASDKRITELQTFISQIEARGAGKSQGISLVGVMTLGVVTGIASLVSIATLAFNILHR